MKGREILIEIWGEIWFPNLWGYKNQPIDGNMGIEYVDIIIGILNWDI